MAGSGRQILAGTEKALDLLRSLPRVALNNLKNPPRAFAKNERGRGQHGGKKHGCGNKGSLARQNYPRLGYETGNNPFYLRVPKEPYYQGQHLKREYPPLSLLCLQTLIDTGRVDISKPLDLAALCNTKLFKMSPINNQYGFQLTDEGLDNFCAKVNIEVQYASEQAIAAIERNGGVITTAWYDAESLLAITNPMKFFTRGVPIPKRQMPPENAVEYYTNPKNRGYLADPDLVAEERFKLAQKYGYVLPDLKADPTTLPLMLERKDARQVFYGLNPGWLVNLRDKKIYEPDNEQLLQYYAN